MVSGRGLWIWHSGTVMGLRVMSRRGYIPLMLIGVRLVMLIIMVDMISWRVGQWYLGLVTVSRSEDTMGKSRDTACRAYSRRAIRVVCLVTVGIRDGRNILWFGGLINGLWRWVDGWLTMSIGHGGS